MERRDTTTILEEILMLLKKEDKLSFRRIQFKTKTQWRTLKRCLDFLVKFDLISETKTGKEKNSPRLFSFKR
jgi:predicted transcriptional regulator